MKSYQEKTCLFHFQRMAEKPSKQIQCLNSVVRTSMQRQDAASALSRCQLVVCACWSVRLILVTDFLSCSIKVYSLSLSLRHIFSQTPTGRHIRTLHCPYGHQAIHRAFRSRQSLKIYFQRSQTLVPRVITYFPCLFSVI